ncbi:hypothetical protein EVAR_77867_1 [Eumeta japonica]|uniref:Endonuclease/exonuclease/phosphatase domain-containing protein n=1 Tax=Eumeta variegata TaxID=151549 RepID=A0A4C1TDX2_EUMVA|nr:hypothetical protein EVAR_77867_1 [Eumeta japonica]
MLSSEDILASSLYQLLTSVGKVIGYLMTGVKLSLYPLYLEKFMAEAERTKHAQELVRIERPHNKDLTNVVETLTEELSQAREDVRKSLDETQSIRDWLGYETEESKETNKEKSGAKVERVRKARNQKVTLKCSTKEDKMRSRKEIKVKAAKAANPLLIMKGKPYVGNQGNLKQNPGIKVIQCTVGRQKPMKAVIIVFRDKVEVLHNPQLVTETESAVLLQIGRMKLGIISIYFEGDEDIEPYIIRTKKTCKNLGTENLIIAGDINACSHWWGSQREDRRGQSYRDFLDKMGFHILQHRKHSHLRDP